MKIICIFPIEVGAETLTELVFDDYIIPLEELGRHPKQKVKTEKQVSM